MGRYRCPRAGVRGLLGERLGIAYSGSSGGQDSAEKMEE